MTSLHAPAPLGADPFRPAESAWRAPLVPAGLVLTAGFALDRLYEIPYFFSLVLALSALVGFVCCRLGGQPYLAPLYLALAGLALAAAYHHYRRDLHPADDIGLLLSDRPVAVRLRGVLVEEPRRTPAGDSDRLDPLRSQQRQAAATTVVEVQASLGEQEWPLSGRVAVFVSASTLEPHQPLLVGLHPGDEVALFGHLSRPPAPGNPGEFDRAGYYRNRGIRALLHLPQGDAAVRLLQRRWYWSLQGWLGWLRDQTHARLQQRFDDPNRPSSAALVRALLVGDGAPLTRDEWSKFIRTGVVHVLAISGQHLAVLGLALWFLALRLGIPQRRAVLLIAALLLGYALLTGGRPPVLRAAIAICFVGLGVLLYRPAVPANLLALGWILVLLVQPADMIDPGTQFSFLAVTVLIWATPWVFHRPDDPLRELIEASRPAWQRWLLSIGRSVAAVYLLNAILWLSLMPLAVYHHGLLPTPGLWLGPPVSLLASGALLGGFVVLLLPDQLSWLVGAAVGFVQLCLGACEWLVDVSESWPHYFYPGLLPLPLVAGFYLGILLWMTHPPWYAAVRRLWLLVPLWLCLVALVGLWPRDTSELRTTFLAVGHGTCIVVELPDGRVLLYDAGSLRGPEVTAQIIAPFLWQRNISRIDDIIVSHADLDHFNGLEALLERFAVGRVLCADSFLASDKPGVRRTLEQLTRRGVPVQTLACNDRLLAGEVVLQVLHPPVGFEQGNDNARSLVVTLEYLHYRLLLTGDLEGQGLATMLQGPARRVDVLQAPHHGSARLDIEGLLDWCQPRCVISCQGPSRTASPSGMAYTRSGVQFLDTHHRGAITVYLGGNGLRVQSFHAGLRLEEDEE